MRAQLSSDKESNSNVGETAAGGSSGRAATDKDAISFVWARFGFSRHDAEQNKAKCKCCWKIAAALRGNMSNLCHHLKHNLVIHYAVLHG